jgi:hypothetical protein
MSICLQRSASSVARHIWGSLQPPFPLSGLEWVGEEGRGVPDAI